MSKFRKHVIVCTSLDGTSKLAESAGVKYDCGSDCGLTLLMYAQTTIIQKRNLHNIKNTNNADVTVSTTLKLVPASASACSSSGGSTT